jgi:uncharacterized protein
MMSSDYLGRGWKLLVDTGDANRVVLVDGEDNVRQAIWMILSTAPGERVMRPDFGCGMHSLVFAPAGAETAGHVASLVREALMRWEPRIEVLDVRVDLDGVALGVLLIAVEYRILATNAAANLVYPFYLE